MNENRTSLAKVEANRKNAQKSTGPKNTFRSRLNALKHGILSEEVILKEENAELLEKLGKSLRTELRPIGELEQVLVDRVVSSIWRLKRALRVETAVMEYNASEVDDSDYQGEPYGRTEVMRMRLRKWLVDDDNKEILRYETTIEKQIYKALHELERVQALRRGEKIAPPVAVDVEVSTQK